LEIVRKKINYDGLDELSENVNFQTVLMKSSINFQTVLIRKFTDGFIETVSNLEFFFF
jgi:hypothetical protein